MKQSKNILFILSFLLFACNQQKNLTEGLSKVHDSSVVSDSISSLSSIPTYQKSIFYSIHPSLPKFRFHLFGDSLSGVVDSIQISKMNDTLVFQTIECELHNEPFISFKDFDFNRYEDIVLICGYGAHGNSDNDIWLYNIVTGKFDYNEEISHLVSPSVYYEDSTIGSSWSGGFNFYHYATFKFINNELVLIKEEMETPNDFTRIAIKVVLERHNGVMDTVEIDTVKMME